MPSLDGTRSSLDEKWKIFLEIDATRRADKLEALDTFLADLVPLPEVLSDLKSQLSGGLNGISSILTRHFLVDVHEICVSSENEDETPLLRYLVDGRGLVILSVLRVLGVQEITCNWELANLLMSIIASFQNNTANLTVESKFAKALRMSLELNSAADQFIPTLQLLPAILPQMNDSFLSDDSMALRRPVDGDVSVRRWIVSAAEDIALIGQDHRPTDVRHVLDSVFSLLEQLCRNDVSAAPSPTVSAMVLTVALELLTKIATDRQRPMGTDCANVDLTAADTYVVQKMVALAVSTAVAIVQQPTSTGAELRRSKIFAVLTWLTRQQLDRLGRTVNTTDLAQDLESVNAAASSTSHARYEMINCLLGCMELMLASSFAARGRTSLSVSAIHGRVLDTFAHFFQQLSGADLLGDVLGRLLHGQWSVNVDSQLNADRLDHEESRSRYAVLKVVWTIGEVAAHLRASRLAAAHMAMSDRHSCHRQDGSTGHHHSLRRASIVESTVECTTPQSDIPCFDSSQCPVALSVCLLLRLLDAGYGWPDATRALLAALARCGVCCCLKLDDYFSALLDGVCRCEVPSLQERILRLLESAVAGSATFTVPFDCVVAVCEQCQHRLGDSLDTLNCAILRMKASGTLDGIWNDPEFVDGYWKVFSKYVDVLANVDYQRLRLFEHHLTSILMTTGADEVRLELFVRLFVPLLSRLADGTTMATVQYEELTSYCLQMVTSLLDLPHAYRLLVSSRCLDRMFRLMCSWSGTLRQALLRLLVKVMLLETKIEENRAASVVKVASHTVADNLNPAEKVTVMAETKSEAEIERNFDWPDSTSTRLLYRNMVLSHTVWFRNALNPTSAPCPPGIEVTPDHSHGGGEDNFGLLGCLADLWRTLCHLVDHSTGTIKWETHERATIANIVITLVRHPDNQINDQLSTEAAKDIAINKCGANLTTRLRWDLFGSLLHVLATSSQHNDVTNENDSFGGFNHFLDTLRSALITKMADGKCHPFVIGCLFRSLMSAALVTRLDESTTEETCGMGMDHVAPDLVNRDEAFSRSSSVCSKSVCSEQGYEGDAEEDDIAGRRWQRRTGLRYDRRLVSGPRPAFPPAIRCPQLLRLALDLAVASYNLNTVPGSGQSIANLSDLHRALLDVCEESLSNRNIIIYEVGVTNYVLTSLRDVLLSSGSDLSDLQDSMLGLLASCACHSITAHELRSFFKLFTCASAPLQKLHDTFGKIIANLIIVPHVCLHFFSDGGEAPALGIRSPGTSRPVTGHRRQRSNGEFMVSGTAFLLKKSKICRENFTNSGWAASSLAVTFPADPNFASSSLPPDKGLTISFWLNINSCDVFDSSERTFSQLHLFSCGTDRMLLEVWLQQSPRAIVARLSSLFQESYRVLVERTVAMPELLEDVWQHLAIGWSTEHRHPNRYKKSLAMRLVVWLDGTEAWNGLLECPLQRRYKDGGRWVLLFGHTTPDRMQLFSWSLGSLMVFGGTTLDVQTALLLSTATPNCVQLELPVDSHFIKDGVWQELNELLLASFVPRSWQAFTWHPELRRASLTVRASSLPTVVLGDFVDSANHRLNEAVAGVGGAATLVGLFAWTVECCSDEEVQASCFSNVVAMTRKCPYFKQHFRALAGWDLLVKVLSTSKCTMGVLMLSNLMDACTSGDPVLRCYPFESRWHVNRNAPPVLVNSELLIKMMENWQMFHRQGQKSVLRLFLKTCHILLGGEMVDWSRLSATDVLEKVLMLCRERALDGESQVLSYDTATVVVDLLRLVARKCETEAVVSSLLAFLVLLQPAHQMEVCHAKTSFFFLPVLLMSRPNWPSKKQRGSDHGVTVEPAMLVQPHSSQYLSKESKILANEQLKLATESLGFDHVPSADNQNVAADISNLKDNCESSDLNDAVLPSRSIMSNLEAVALISCEPLHLAMESFGQPIVESIEDHQLEGMSPVEVDTLAENKTAVEGPWVEKECLDQDKSTSPSVDSPSDVSSTTTTTDLGIICQGVLGIICDCLTADRDKVLPLIDPRLLTVLALHPEESVRQLVLRLFQLVVTISLDKLQGTAARRCLFALLANQLYQYEATLSTVETCVAICRSESEFTFDTYRTDEQQQVSFLSASVPLILALIPKTCHSFKLCHSLICMLNKVPTDTLFDLFNGGLPQSLLASVSLISHNGTISCDNRLQLLTDVSTLLSNAVLCCINTSGSISQGRVRDTLRLISHYELIEAQRCGTDSDCLLAYRDVHCSVLYVAIHNILETFEWDCGYRDRFRLTHDHLLQTATRFRASTSDLKMRFAELVSAAVDFIWFADIIYNELSISDYERTFSRFLLQMLIDGALVLVDRQRSHGTAKWYPLVFTTHDCFRSQLGRILVLFLSPTQQLAQKTFALELLAQLPDIGCLMLAFKQNQHLALRFSSLLLILLRDHCGELVDNVAANQLLAMQALLKKVLTNVDDVTATTITDGMLEEAVQGKHVWIQTNSNQLKRFLATWEGAAGSLAEVARQIGDVAVSVQNEQRKLYLVHVKHRLNDRLAVRRRWQALVEQLTHERAPWHRPDAYPQSWRLDPTEGPHRIRRRLERCQLTVQPRFVLAKHRDKLAAANQCPPLAYLFERDDVSGDLAAINERIQNTEAIVGTFSCVIVTPSTEAHGEILFGSHCLYYIGEESYKHSSTSTPAADVVSHTWHFDEIVEVHRRRFQLRDHALELFLSSGRTHLLSLPSQSERDALYQQLTECDLPNLVAEHENLSMHTSAWRDRAITNFEYLTQLNKAAGRSFNDLMQYPVLPFILADYTSDVLCLQSASSFRNLARPMAIQDASKEQRYVSQYRFLDSEQAAGDPDDFLMPAIGPYHYGSHYSNTGIVLHFLVRLAPFTAMFLEYQGNSFDIPDRTFHSVATSWRLSSSESTTDVKELIPEFFTLPEFLTNAEGFDFGVRQTGERVSDVTLPTWCRHDPRLFVLIHRQALESSPITENLHLWIDLVFGFKQTGRAAVDAVNVFHPATYYGFDVSQITDPLRREAMLTMTKMFGQTPRQLFRTAHPMTSLSPTHNHRTGPVGQALSVMEEVRGLCWGSYAGSPDQMEPHVVWRRNYVRPIRTLVSLITNEVFGLEENQCLLVRYCRTRSANLLNTTYVASAALILHGFRDGVVRLRLSRDSPTMPLFAADPIDPVTRCATAPDCPLLFIGKRSGAVSVYRTSFDATRQAVRLADGDPVELHGHRDAITDIAICRSYSVAVTASRDCTCILWDLNRMTYVRSLDDHRHAVQAVTVSDTSGDVASVSDLLPRSSRLALHTINGKLVGSVTTDASIRSVCFSCAPEGTSVNVLCAGLQDGTVLMWSSWDLKPVRRITLPGLPRPVFCLAYSLDSQHLYAANSDGAVYIWASASEQRTCVPKFRTVI